MSLTTDGTQITMPVVPAGSYGGNNNGGAWGDGNGVWWLLVLFIFAFGWGGFGGFGGGYGNGGVNSPAGQGALTRSDLCQDMNFQEVKREVQNANDAVNLGFSNLNSTICNQQYDTARMINGVESTVQGGFNATNMAMLQGFNNVQAQAADCCCKTQSGIEGLKYTIATEDCATRAAVQNGFRDSMENANANTRAILDKLTSQEMEAKNAQIAALNQQLFTAQLAASQSAQTNQLINTLRPCPQPAYITCSPFQSSYGIGLNNGNCGCGCNGGYAA